MRDLPDQHGHVLRDRAARQQMLEPGYRRLRPFWRYIHSDAVIHPRKQHLAWPGLTLPCDHPF